MNQRHYLLKGTLILTLTGLVTRTAGFFYKIFLSRTLGAEQIGVFQLIMPVYSFFMALACGGIQTAISRFTAEELARKKKNSAHSILTAGLMLSGGFSLLCALFLYFGADLVATHFLKEIQCSKLLRIMAFSLPFCVIHSCIGGYFMGKKNVAPSAVSQLLEQLVRICSAFLFYFIALENGTPMTASVMALGQLTGELASSLYCLFLLHFSEKISFLKKGSISAAKKLLTVSVPLSLNRMLLCILQGIEASLIPLQLQLFGYTKSDALSVYGTLTGMSLPLILFPTALTGALGMLLLPAVSEARALHQKNSIHHTISSSIQSGILLGSFFLFSLHLLGTDFGTVLFESPLAGSYIRSLALLCPFLYLNSTLFSVLHGLGKTTAVFLLNLASFAIRLTCVVLLIPSLEIYGYLYGLIFSQIMTTAAIMMLLKHSHIQTGVNFSMIWKPLLTGACAGAVTQLAGSCIPFLKESSLFPLLLSCTIYAVTFCAWVFLLAEPDIRRKFIESVKAMVHRFL